MRLGIPRIERERLLEDAQRLFWTLGALEGDAQCVVRSGIFWSEPHGLPQVRERLIEPAQMHQRGAAAEVGGSEIGLHGERTVEALDRLGVPSQVAERAAEVGVNDGVGRLQRSGRADESYGV